MLVTVNYAGGLCISIEDDGPGCSEDDLTRLGRRGVRLDESREGHGLGLAMTREIVEQYQGEFTMTRPSALGGLCVQVRLPEGGSETGTVDLDV